MHLRSLISKSFETGEGTTVAVVFHACRAIQYGQSAK